MQAPSKIYSLWYTPHWYDPRHPLQLHFTTDDGVVIQDADLDPYMFVERDKEILAQRYCKKFRFEPRFEHVNLRTLSQVPATQIFFPHPKHVSELRDSIPLQTYEADVKWANRWMIDNNWNVQTDYKKVYFDIEAWDGPSNDTFKKNQMIAISFVDSDGHEQIFYDEDEHTLLEVTNQILMKYHMPIGWNSDLYDTTRIIEGMKKYSIPFENQRWSWLDLMWALRNARQRMLGSWALQYAARTILNKSRVHNEKKIHNSTEDEIKERCLVDSRLLLEIDKKLGLTDSAIFKAAISHTFPHDATFAASCVDALQLRKARELGYVLPTKPKDRKHHSGAMVLQPPEPYVVFKNVAVFDFASLYPNIIISKKISPDDEKRMYPEMAQSLLDGRMDWKRRSRTEGQYAKTMSDAFKIVLNAMYGYLSRRVSREDLGDEVATTGREVILHTARYLSDIGYKVLYIDTDSSFFPIQSFNEKVSSELEAAISAEVYDRFHINVDFECDRFFSTLYFPRIAAGDRAAKKKYCGYISWKKGLGFLDKQELEIVGMESVRSDVPAAFQGLQRTLSSLKLNNASRPVILDAVMTFRQALLSGMINVDDLAIYKTLTREHYKVRVHHAIAAKKAEERGLGTFTVGDKVGYVYTLRGIEPLEPNLTDIAYKHYWEKMAMPIIERTTGISFVEGNHKLDFFT